MKSICLSWVEYSLVFTFSSWSEILRDTLAESENSDGFRVERDIFLTNINYI